MKGLNEAEASLELIMQPGSFKFVILLPQIPECLDYKHMPPHPVLCNFLQEVKLPEIYFLQKIKITLLSFNYVYGEQAFLCECMCLQRTRVYNPLVLELQGGVSHST